jgi:hypothetical protein
LPAKVCDDDAGQRNFDLPRGCLISAKLNDAHVINLTANVNLAVSLDIPNHQADHICLKTVFEPADWVKLAISQDFRVKDRFNIVMPWPFKPVVGTRAGIWAQDG